LSPEEINVLSDGTDFGWPYCFGVRQPNPDYRDPRRCATTTLPALAMQVHSAPLEITFYTRTQFPEEYRGDLFIAFHGSMEPEREDRLSARARGREWWPACLVRAVRLGLADSGRRCHRETGLPGGRIRR
jgi:glucose/arabinose dehydrogenase